LDFVGPGILSVLIFLPLIAAVIILTSIKSDNLVKYFALIIASLELIISLYIFASFDRDSSEKFQFIDSIYNWISVKSFNVQYLVGIDGLSLPLILLCTILIFVAVLASWSLKIRVREYFTWLLVLQSAVLGVFCSLDLIMFFLFWELELIPMFFLISIWGTGRKEYSAMKFLLYTLFGSAFLLIGILAIYFSTETFDMTLLPTIMKSSVLILPATLIFFMFLIGFAVKLPIFPFHTWLPDAHTDAPTAVSVILAGVLLKMGGYGILRIIITLFNEPSIIFAYIFALLGVVNIIYGALITLRQKDLKRLIAYSSISHMGYVLLGFSAIASTNLDYVLLGLTGASMQMFTHGTITGLLFLSVGIMYDKTHTRYIPDLGGLSKKLPMLTIAIVIAGLASLGLPSTSGFISELLIFFSAFNVFPIYTIIGVTGIVLTAGYILWMLQRTFFGKLNERYESLSDVDTLQSLSIYLLVFLILFVGIYPSILTSIFETGIINILQISSS
tara:strand:- start:12282 stop:13787 length:1506 start_codon:yes stop_codon:yes gene_type:complete